MKIAVIQHAMRPAPAQDLEALVVAAGRAAALGAGVLVVPELPALDDGPLADELWRRIDEAAPGLAIISAGRGEDAVAAISPVPELVGTTVLLTGDGCIDAAVLASARDHTPDVLVLAPRSESELQAEAVLELAIGLSTSLAALVVIAETDGAGLGESGHGGSAIVHLGEILAEAMSGDDLLLADIDMPAGPPEPRGLLPEVPPILAQRLGAHRGARVPVDYPADLD